MARQLKNWLLGYLAYTNESESPEIFHFWVGVSVIASALRRNVHIVWKYFQLFPNMYIVLVSPAGRCKKSTAMRMGRDPLSKVPGIKLGADSTSRERLIQDMVTSQVDGQSAMTCHSAEFATMLTTSGMDMVVFLTDIFDSPLEWEHRTKSGGPIKIKAPYLNLLAGTTPDWMAKGMPLDTVGIGLTSRTIFVYSNSPRVRDPLDDPSEEQLGLYNPLVHDLTKISQMSGEFKLSDEAKTVFRRWYKEIWAQDVPSGNQLLGYHERKPTHVLKLSMILSAAVSDDMVISGNIVQAAIDKLDEVQEPMIRVFSSVGRNPIAFAYTDMIDFIGGNEVSFGELLDQFRHNMRKEEIQETIETLIAAGYIELLPGNKYRRTDD